MFVCVSLAGCAIVLSLSVVMNYVLILLLPPFYFLTRAPQEKNRQLTSLELIASENFTSAAVMECLGSVLTNKVSKSLV